MSEQKAEAFGQGYLQGMRESVAHQCPPDRVAMMARLTDLEKSYTTRLTNQRQVIENLSMARAGALNHIQELHRFLDTLLESDTIAATALELKARQLLQWEQ